MKMLTKRRSIRIFFIVFCSVLLVLFLNFNKISRHLFESKYSENSVYITKEINNISTIKYSEKDISKYKIFEMFNSTYNVDLKPMPVDELNSIMFDRVDSDYAYNYYMKNPENILKINIAFSLINDSAIVFTDKKMIHEKEASYSLLIESLNLEYVNFLKSFRSKDAKLINKSISDFNTFHNNKINQLTNSNTFSYSLTMLELINNDLKFAKYVFSKYKIKLDILMLSKENYSLEKVIDSEMALYFNLHDNFTNNEYDLRYLKESSYSYIKSLKSYFSKDIDVGFDINVEKNLKFEYNEESGFIEKYGSPVSYLLLQVPKAKVWTYRQRFVDYNKDAFFYNYKV